jgi:hypothetical protein
MSASAQNFFCKAGCSWSHGGAHNHGMEDLNLKRQFVFYTRRWKHLTKVVALSAVPIFENKKSEIQLHEVGPGVANSGKSHTISSRHVPWFACAAWLLSVPFIPSSSGLFSSPLLFCALAFQQCSTSIIVSTRRQYYNNLGVRQVTGIHATELSIVLAIRLRFGWESRCDLLQKL